MRNSTRVPSSVRFRSSSLALIAVLSALAFAPAADATIIQVADPSVATEIGARLRWGGSGFEASTFDASPTLHQSPTLNPGGAPVWVLGRAYAFEITFSAGTGALRLGVDFNRDGDFADAQESAVRTVFTAPGFTSYLGQGFRYLSISGNESGSTARSTITDLVVNGDSQAALAPNGLSVERFYAASNGATLADLVITGRLTFVTSGTSGERPSWSFGLRGPVEVPEPGALPMLAPAVVAAAASAAFRRSSKRASGQAGRV